jgi:hypothetical protein
MKRPIAVARAPIKHRYPKINRKGEDRPDIVRFDLGRINIDKQLSTR